MNEIVFRSDFTNDLVEVSGDDDSVLRAMLISTLKDNQVEGMTPEAKLGRIRFLMRGKHGTPFEHNLLTFRSEAPIFVYREWHRHRIGVCVAGDAMIDFVDINGTRALRICRTIGELWDHWENGEIAGNAVDSERLAEASRLLVAGVSERKVSLKTGIARATLARYRVGLVVPGRRGGRWRLGEMRVRVLDEATGFCTHSVVEDVIRSGVQEVVNLTTARQSLRVTADHLVLTLDGWVKAGSLRRGDRIARVGKVPIHERQIPPRLRQGIGIWTQSRRADLIKEVDQCYRCGGLFPRSVLVLDHVVPVREDLSLALLEANLSPCCGPCHRAKTNTEQSLARRGSRQGAVYEPLTTSPVIVGVTDTYDLSVAGHHNFVANGLIVHNSINEQSGRYVELPPMFYIPPPDRPLLQVGKPGAYEYEPADGFVYAETCRVIQENSVDAYNRYRTLLEGVGIAKEVARMVLPVNIYSSMYWTCNARSLMAFLSLRVRAPGREEWEAIGIPGVDEMPTTGWSMFPSKPMWEIDTCAQALEAAFAKAFPLTHSAFLEFGRVCP